MGFIAFFFNSSIVRYKSPVTPTSSLFLVFNFKIALLFLFLSYIIDLMLNIGKGVSKNNKLHISNKETLPWDIIIDLPFSDQETFWDG